MGHLSDGHWHRLLRLDSLSVVLCSGPAWLLGNPSRDLFLPSASDSILGSFWPIRGCGGCPSLRACQFLHSRECCRPTCEEKRSKIWPISRRQKEKPPKGGGFSIFDRILSRWIRSNAAAPSASAHRPKGPHPGNPKSSSPRWKARERR